MIQNPISIFIKTIISLIIIIAVLILIGCRKEADIGSNQHAPREVNENVYDKTEVSIIDEMSKQNYLLTGVVHLAEPVPELKPIKINRMKKHCNPGVRPNEALIVSVEKGVANAVVYVDFEAVSAPEFKDFELPMLDQQICTFIPHLQIAALGSELLLKNSDPTMHNVHAYIYDFDTYFSVLSKIQLPKKRSIFNITIPFRKLTRRVTLSRPGLIKMVCEVGHPWMHAYIWVVEHPYYAVTDSSGHFKIPQVPAGKWTMKVWHEYLGNLEKIIALTEDLEINFEYGKKISSVLPRK